MKNTCLITLILVLAAVFSNACGGSFSAAANSENPVKESSPKEPGSSKSVDFKGVHFSYDPSVFGNVKSEVVPEYPLKEPDYKPDGVAPEHVRFTFDFGKEYSKAKISVYPLNEFPKVYSVNPDSVERMKKDIEALKKVIKDASIRHEGEIPHLPFIDASQVFHSKVRHYNFENGKGILFVTHVANECGFIINGDLIYRFEGLTNDGRFYITAETPVSVGFLPNESQDEIDGYTWKDLCAHHYDDYINSITSRLEKLNPNDFRPNLEKFESIISSLKVNK